MRLDDGRRISIRPISPDDGPALEAFHEGLSERTVFLRFFQPHRHLHRSEVDRFTHVDYRERLALVAEHDGHLVAVGRYDRESGTVAAEVAFVVADEFQHHGIATTLLALLADEARRCGIEVFTAEVLAENTAMLRVFHAAGFTTESHISYGTVELTMAIGALPARGTGEPPGGAASPPP